MANTDVIAHGFTRAGVGQAVGLTLRDSPFSASGYLDEMLRELKQAFVGKAGKQYGAFHPDHSMALVGQWFRDFLDEKQSFVNFSRRAMEHWQSTLAESDVCADAHLIFVVEKLADHDALYLYMVRHNEGLSFDGEVQLGVNRYLDVRGVLAAARLDITAWLRGEQVGYLSILKARGEKDLTDLFWRWLGFADERDIKGETNQFLDAVSAFTAELEEEKKQQVRHQIVDFCVEQDQQGEAVELKALSRHIDEQAPEAFAGFVQRYSEEMPEKLYPDRRQLKQFVRISGRDDRLSMSFSAECLGQTVVYDKDDDSLIIRDIPAPLKMRLLKHMRGDVTEDS